jgi:hypothetical protein
MHSGKTTEWPVEMHGKQSINRGIFFIMAYANSEKAIADYKICKYGLEEPRDGLTIDGFWIDDSIYCTLDTARDYTSHLTITHNSVHSHVFTAVVGSGFQRRTFPFLWVSELFSASATSFLQQQLTTTELQQVSN